MASASFQGPREWKEWTNWLSAGLHGRNQWRLPILLVGILFAQGRRTVSTWLRAAGVSPDYVDYYYFLASVGCNAKLVSWRLLSLVLQMVPLPERVLLVLDDTPTKRYGPKVEGADVHHNPTPGPADQEFLYGHVWVMLSLAVRHSAWGALALPLRGRVAHVAGPRRLLWIGGVAIVPIAGLWLFADPLEGYKFTLPVPLGFTTLHWNLTGELVYLAFVQAASGIAWAAYELAMALMFFEAIPRSQRTSMLAIYNFGNAAALVAGSLLGAAVLQLLSESHFAYLCLFALTTLARLSTLALLFATPERPVEELAIAGPESQLRRPVSTGGQN